MTFDRRQAGGVGFRVDGGGHAGGPDDRGPDGGGRRGRRRGARSMPPGCATRPRPSPGPQATRRAGVLARGHRTWRRRRAAAGGRGGRAPGPLPLRPAAERAPRARRSRRSPLVVGAGRPAGRDARRRAGQAARRAPRNWPATWPTRRTATSPRSGLADVASRSGGGRRPRGRGVRQGRPGRAGLRRAARRQRRQRRAAADDQADATRPTRRADAAGWRSSARGSCTTPAASPSSPATRSTPR